MPIDFSLSFTNSLIIKKIEIHYEGAGRLNTLTVYATNARSNHIVSDLLTGRSQFGWKKGRLALPEMMRDFQGGHKAHTKLHPTGGKDWHYHQHNQLTDLTPATLLEFVSRIAAIQEHPTLRINYYHCYYESPIGYLPFYFNSPYYLVNTPLLTEEEQSLLLDGYTEAYLKEFGECPLSPSGNLPEFLNEPSPQPQCLRITASPGLREAVGFAAINLREEAFVTSVTHLVLLLVLVLFIHKCISRCRSDRSSSENRYRLHSPPKTQEIMSPQKSFEK